MSDSAARDGARVLNATNSPATIEVGWNQRTRARHEVKQLKVLPILGFNIKF